MISFSSLESLVDLRLLKKGLLGLSLGVLALIPVDLATLPLSARGGFAFGGKGEAPMKTGSAVQEKSLFSSTPSEPLSAYESSFQKSSLFGLATPEAPLPVFQSSIAELVKDLRLKGVVILDEAEAIIEDARTQKGAFVKAGEKIGELTVKEIKEGAIVLSYYGEDKEMRIE